MGIEIMKSNGTRCPSILVAGLFITCLYLLCTWWSLSSQASELVKQLDNLAEELKTYGDVLGKCIQDRNLLAEKLKDSQNRFVQQQIKIEQVEESENEVKESYQKVETELEESKKKSESVEKNLGMCQAELDSLKKLGESKDKATETLRAEIESLKSEIEQKKKQVNELESQLKSFNKTNKTGNAQVANKLIQSLVKNLDPALKEKTQKTVNIKNENEVNTKKEQQNEEKFEYRRNYGDSELLSLDNDPREEEMKDS